MRHARLRTTRIQVLAHLGIVRDRASGMWIRRRYRGHAKRVGCLRYVRLVILPLRTVKASEKRRTLACVHLASAIGFAPTSVSVLDGGSMCVLTGAVVPDGTRH